MAKFGLIMFYVDCKVDVVKKSMCILRQEFKPGNDVEVRIRKDVFLARILRTNECEKPLTELCTDACKLIEDGMQSGKRKAEELIVLLNDSLNWCRDDATPDSSASKSQRGRNRRKIDYNLLAAEEPETPTEKGKNKNKKRCNKASKLENTELSGHGGKKKKGNPKNESEDDEDILANDLEEIFDLELSQTSQKSHSKSQGKRNSQDHSKPKKMSVDLTKNSEKKVAKKNNHQDTRPAKKMDFCGVEATDSTSKKKSKTPVTEKTTSKPDDDSIVAEKQPKKRPCCPNPICVGHRQELAKLKEKYGALEAKLKKLETEKAKENHTEVSGSNNYLSSGVMNPEQASEKKLVELVAGSGVYLSRTKLALCKASGKTKSSLACQLLRVFFSDEELRGGKLSTHGKEGKLLNQSIVTTIKAYSARQDLPAGARKGIAHGMTMSIKNLRRSYKPSKDSTPSVLSSHQQEESSSDEDYSSDDSLL